MKRCPMCQGTFPDTKRFCSHCGTALPESGATGEPTSIAADSLPRSRAQTPSCPACGQALPNPKATFCRYCGLALREPGEVATTFKIQKTPSVPSPPARVNKKSADRKTAYVFLAIAVVVTGILFLVSLRSSREDLPRQQPTRQTVAASRASPITPRPTPPRKVPTPQRILPPPILSEGLAAYWRFDADASDQSGHGHHGKVFGDLRYGQGIANTGAVFDGKSSYVEVSDHASLQLQAFTLSAWIMPYRISGSEKILDKGSYTLLINREGKPALGLQFRHGYVMAISPEPLKISDRYFVAGTFDGQSMHLYVNDALANTQPVRSWPITNTKPLVIGGELLGNPEKHFHGIIDDVRVYSRALPSKELGQLYRTAARVGK